MGSTYYLPFKISAPRLTRSSLVSISWDKMGDMLGIFAVMGKLKIDLIWWGAFVGSKKPARGRA